MTTAECTHNIQYIPICILYMIYRLYVNIFTIYNLLQKLKNTVGFRQINGKFRDYLFMNNRIYNILITFLGKGKSLNHVPEFVYLYHI
jgi:hypothetical protein